MSLTRLLNTRVSLLFSKCLNIAIRVRLIEIHGLAWIFVVLGDSYDTTTHSWNPAGAHVIGQQDFWFAILMTTL
jgi:hypothetical protein